MTTEQIPNNEAGGAGSGASATGIPHGGPAGYDTDAFSRPLYRSQEGRILGGVAAGLARYLDVDVSIVRVVIALLAVLGGVGVPLYLAGWLLIPEEGTGCSVIGDLLHPHTAL